MTTTTTMNTNTGLTYLNESLRKEADPLNPNFEKKLKPKTKAMYLGIKAAVKQALRQFPDDPRRAAVTAGKLLSNDAQAYITYWKDLASSAAFLAHMDCVRLERQVDQHDLDGGMGSMLDEDHGSEPTLFDQSFQNRDAQRESYAGAEEPLIYASSIADAVEAINGLQGWITLAFSGMKDEQREYWGVDAVCPLGQARYDGADGQPVYQQILDFESYRQYQTEQWEKKRNSVAIPLDVADAMLQA